LFGKHQSDQVLATLRAENSDLRAQLRLERDQWNEERAKLLDRILALAAPAALRESRRPSSSAATPDHGPAHARLHFPDYTPNLRPPSPTTRPSVPDRAPLTDHQIVEVIRTADLPEVPNA
jgi:hypothetical protein